MWISKLLWTETVWCIFWSWPCENRITFFCILSIKSQIEQREMQTIILTLTPAPLTVTAVLWLYLLQRGPSLGCVSAQCEMWSSWRARRKSKPNLPLICLPPKQRFSKTCSFHQIKLRSDQTVQSSPCSLLGWSAHLCTSCTTLQPPFHRANSESAPLEVWLVSVCRCQRISC